MSTNYKFEEAKNKLILQAEARAMAYLSSKYGISKLAKDSSVELTHQDGSIPHTFDFTGKITCYADSGTLLTPIVGVNMTVNSNDIEIASEESIADKVENSLNAQQELEPIKASLDGFKLKDRGDGYLLVSHSNLEEANLGILGQIEYDKSPNKQELLETIVTDSMARTASYNKIEFTGSFVEPIIEKVAEEEIEKDAKGSSKKHGPQWEKVWEQEAKDRKEKEEQEKQPKKSWLTADFDTIPQNPMCPNCNMQMQPAGETAGMEHYWCEDCGYEGHIPATQSKEIAVGSDMPKASSADHLAQVAQLEEQLVNASNEKIKTQAVNALVSMLQSQGFGTAKVREVTASNTGFDVMVTVDADATLKAVNIPVEVKESNIILPKKSLVATLVASGLDLNARLSEEFGKQVLARIEAEEARIQYEQNEANAILAERPTVKKEASGYDNTMFLGDQDILELQKHLIPGHEDLKKGDKISDGSSQWEIIDTEWQQNDKNENSSSIWKLRKCAPPKSAEKEPETKVKI